MARSYWYYGKKRGHRRTGSPALASAGEALFFAVFLLLGCGGFVLFFTTLVVPQWRVNHEFAQNTCKVLAKRIAETQGTDGTLYRPEFMIEYDVDDVTYGKGEWHYDIHKTYSSGRENAQTVLDRFDLYDKAKQNVYPCWYDPANPREVVLARGYRWWIWLVFTVPASFVVIGAGGLIYTLLHRGKSAEHRAAMMQRTLERELFNAGPRGDQQYPSIPQGADIINSPGTKLRFRLPAAASTGWALFGALAFCVLWNGVVSVFVAMALRSHIAGKPEWALTFFIVPFLLIGLGAIVVFIRRLLVATGIGPTLMEISDHPLHPGGQYRVFLSQSGRLIVGALRVSLVCVETAAYRQGTNSRTETREVHRHEAFCREGFDVQSGRPLEVEFDLELPAGVMHSFKAAHNEIAWTLVVDGHIDRWPNFRRAFPVIVRPAGRL